MSLAGRITQAVRSRVYLRRAQVSPPPINGALDGWTLEPNLQCVSVRHEVGPRVGTAELEYTQRGGTDAAIESMLARYTTDDQVRIVVDPVDDQLIDQDPDGRVLFEGVLSRQVMSVNGDARAARESLRFVAQPLTDLDNEHPDHIVLGPHFTRPVDDTTGGAEATDELFVVEDPLYPACFNFRGRPNRAAERKVKCKVVEEGMELLAYAFAADGDKGAKYWTVGDALAAIVAVWLFGANGKKLNRHADLETVAAEQLIRTDDLISGEVEGRPEEFKGLDDVLPETNVQGLGAYDAIARVCQVSGFDFALLPIADVNPRNQASDRRFQLRFWRRGTGFVEWLDLDKRGRTYGNASNALEANNTTNLNGMRDAREIVNVITGAAQTLLECRLPLKPMWKPGDVFAGEPTTDPDEVKEELETPGTYSARHIAGGAEFHAYGQVGRVWGLDCTGALAADFYPVDGTNDPNNLYVHAEEGFDFVDHLKLNAASEITGEREAAGITDPIRWSKRVRRVLPLKNPDAIARGVNYVLEVSEDGGTTWHVTKVRFSTLADQLGIFLSVRNLAEVNHEGLSSGAEVELAASWWELMKDRQLTFRITCVIEADHAMRHLARRRPSSGSRYSKAQYLALDTKDVLVQPGTIFNASSIWTRVSGYLPFASGQIPRTVVRGAAERRRDALEDSRVAMTASVWPLDFDRYALGDRIRGLRGRGVSFDSSSGTGRYPNLVGITYILSPVAAQGIELTLQDQRLVGAR